VTDAQEDCWSLQGQEGSEGIADLEVQEMEHEERVYGMMNPPCQKTKGTEIEDGPCDHVHQEISKEVNDCESAQGVIRKEPAVDVWELLVGSERAEQKLIDVVRADCGGNEGIDGGQEPSVWIPWSFWSGPTGDLCFAQLPLEGALRELEPK